MIESDGTAPYAPTTAVMSVIDAYRNRSVAVPMTTDVVKRIGISDSLAHRTVQSLKLLDLLDDDGNPTPAFEDLRKVGEDEFPARLADVVRAAYADVFAYRDPATDDAAKIVDAFRVYKPPTMRVQMARLFLGLCREAGIITEAPQITSTPKPGKPKARKSYPSPIVNPKHSKPAPKSSESPFTHGGLQFSPNVVAGADHLAIRGLLQTLPPVGAVFPETKRREWADAVLAAFALIYEREPQSRKGGEGG